ncbi:MAG: CoA pyrophosphatase [Gammaproteobacteria bacterium]
MTNSAGQISLPQVRAALASRPSQPVDTSTFRTLYQLEQAPARAAVLCALIDGPGGLEVVLTRRVEAMRHHAGQVSFPGGRMDPEDANEEATALREAHEEIGLQPASVSVLGRLNELPTITGFRVTPVVAHVTGTVAFVPNPGEVALVFSVPLAWLLDDANVTRQRREFNGRRVVMHRFDWQDEVIWGATAAMIMDLKKALTTNER